MERPLIAPASASKEYYDEEIVKNVEGVADHTVKQLFVDDKIHQNIIDSHDNNKFYTTEIEDFIPIPLSTKLSIFEMLKIFLQLVFIAS